MLNTIFILKVFKFCPDFLGDIGERFDKKAKVNFKIFDVIDGTKKN